MFYSFTVQWWCDGREITNRGYVYGDDYKSAVDRLIRCFGDEDTASIQITIVDDTEFGVMVTDEIT